MNKDISTANKNSKKRGKSDSSLQSLFRVSSLNINLPGLEKEGISPFCGKLKVELRSKRKTSVCPDCGVKSRHRHSTYKRLLQDIGVYDKGLLVELKVGKYYCKNPACNRHIFTERLPDVCRPYGRNTLKAEERIQQVSLKLSASSASKELDCQHISVSPSSCLRRLYVLGDENPDCDSVYVGMDDLAYKKGHIYMSAVVDHKTGRVVAILADRSGKTVEDWLAKNKQIQYITRDRGQCFVQAIDKELPHATQICDRFHLIKNIIDGMTPELKRLQVPPQKRTPHQHPTKEEAERLIVEGILSMGDAKHRDKLYTYREGLRLQSLGYTIKEIASQLDKTSVQVYRIIHNKKITCLMTDKQKIAFKHVSEVAAIISNGTLDVATITKQMDGRLGRELIGKITWTLRKEHKENREKVRQANKKAKEENRENKLSKQQIRELIIDVMKTPNDAIREIYRLAPDFKEAVGLCQEFRDIINGKGLINGLKEWLLKVKQSACRVLKNFAYGIEKDIEAVQAAIDIPLSNGIVEGTVNRIKAIKRQMYNRAGIRLLRAKVIYGSG